MKRIWQLLPAALGASLMLAVPAHARNYDCSKAGNANKAVCKGAAAPTTTAKPAKPAAPKPAVARKYDCTKAGNANKAVCKGTATTAPTQAPARPSAPSKPYTAPASRPMAPASTSSAGPNGATAMCNDGTYSHSAHRSGTCSHHGGVKTWY